MSMNLWKVDNNEIVLIAQTNEQLTHYKHAMIVDGMNTYKYWDYLAWGISTLGNPRILSIGHALGTFTQIATNWGISLSGVGFEIDKRYKEINSNFGKINIKYVDFRKGIESMNSKFDAIIVDVYNNKGYVDDAYNIAYLEKYINLRTDGGVILLHCLDFVGTILAAGLEHPELPTVLTTMIRRIRSLVSEKIFIIPMWSSYLIWIGEPPRQLKIKNKSVRWTDQFFRSRLYDIATDEIGIEILKKPWTFDKINTSKSNLLMALTKNNSGKMKKLQSLLDIMTPVLEKGNKSDISEAIEVLSSNNDRSVAENHMLSFLYALRFEWRKALRLLDNQYLFEPLLKIYL